MATSLTKIKFISWAFDKLSTIYTQQKYSTCSVCQNPLSIGENLAKVVISFNSQVIFRIMNTRAFKLSARN